jgi:hypothetical protein
MNNYKNSNIPRYWSQLSYTNTKRVPPSEEPVSESWPTYFLKKDENGNFTDACGNIIAFKIREPNSSIDFEEKELSIVKETLENLTSQEKSIATYWGTGPATKQWTPIIDILIDTYKISAPRAARILAATYAALNDTFAVCWYFKFRWEIARPNQLDQNLISFLPMPNHPSYPSGHAAVAGCAEVVLSYFFKSEKIKLRKLAEECALSRLYAGVHFPIDNSEGLNLGRHIGTIIVGELNKQYDYNLAHIDYPINEYYDAQLPPPPYHQIIPYLTKDSMNYCDYDFEFEDNSFDNIFDNGYIEPSNDCSANYSEENE